MAREDGSEFPGEISLSPRRTADNPSEYFNGDLKGAIQRDIPPRDHAQLNRTILTHSRRIQKSPDRVRKYFEPVLSG